MTNARRAIARSTAIAAALAIVVSTGATAKADSGSSLAQANTLNAVVASTTPLTLTLTGSDGFPVQVLPAGTYTVVVEDRSSTDNFHLIGPSLDQQTTTEFVGSVTWTLNLTPGGYTYRSDGPGASSCGCSPNFSVSAPPPAKRPTTPAPAKLQGTIAERSISLKTGAGARAQRVAAGRYVIVVIDRSRRDNFHLSGRGVNRQTGMKFTGRTSWTVTLAPRSLYRYGSDSNPSLRRTFRTLD